MILHHVYMVGKVIGRDNVDRPQISEERPVREMMILEIQM